jgi:Protein of unknown function (DUF3224)
MKSFGLIAAVAAVLYIALSIEARAQSTTPQPAPAQKEAPVSSHATGSFDVKLLKQEDPGADTSVGRFTLDKQYHGDLEASGKGQMLTASTEVKGSGAYVAIERVAGTLKGREGSFALEHMGTMAQNVPTLTINIVPDSGTGQLKGISGKMNIIIASDGKHSYELDYTLP